MTKPTSKPRPIDYDAGYEIGFEAGQRHAAPMAALTANMLRLIALEFARIAQNSEDADYRRQAEAICKVIDRASQRHAANAQAVTK